MSKRKFITIDFLMMLLITLIIEVGLYIYAKNIDISTAGFTITFVVNLYITMSLLVMYRWNWLGILFNLITTIVYLLISLIIAPVKELNSQEILNSSLVYLAGVVMFSLNLFWFKIIDKKKIATKPIVTIAYVFSGFLLIVIGRTIMAAIQLIIAGESFSPIGIFLVHGSNELLNLVLGIVVFMILRKQKDIVQDMNEYLLQLANSKELAKDK